MKSDNFSTVLQRFVDALKIPITPSSIRNELRKHPDYNSLVAYNDVLANYGIYTSAYSVSFEHLSKITLPAITCLTDRNYAIITEVNRDYVILSDDKRKRKKVNNEQFKKLYNGVVQVRDSGGLTLRHVDSSQKQNIMLNAQPYVGFILAALLIGLFWANSNFSQTLSWPLLLLTIFKASGIFFSCLLLIQSIDANNPLINRFCNASEKVDCSAILSSDTAKLTSFLSWSEVGFFYFTGSFLALIFIPSSLSILAWLNILALPYTVYSIYYQYKVAKKWCTLCCAVQVLLWAEFLSFLPYLSFDPPSLSVITVVNVLMLFTLPVTLWLLVKPFLLRVTEIDVIENQLRTLKYNKQIFTAALKEKPSFETPDLHFSIVLGSKQPRHVITMVASPFCGPCAQAHQQVEEALKTINHLQVRIVFAGNDLERKDDTIAVRRHLMALKEFNDTALLRRALDDWYSEPKRNYDKWATKYPVIFSDQLDTLLTQQKDWVKGYKITQTPTILINGYKMPLIYQLHELKYMLD